MKLQKVITIEIDLDAERKRIKTPRMYNKEKRQYLHKLVDLFEVGDTEGIYNLMKSVPKEYHEYHNIQIDDVILDHFNLGARYTIVKD
jgi:hypothetical protein